MLSLIITLDYTDEDDTLDHHVLNNFEDKHPNICCEHLQLQKNLPVVTDTYIRAQTTTPYDFAPDLDYAHLVLGRTRGNNSPLPHDYAILVPSK